MTGPKTISALRLRKDFVLLRGGAIITARKALFLSQLMRGEITI